MRNTETILVKFADGGKSTFTYHQLLNADVVTRKEQNGTTSLLIDGRAVESEYIVNDGRPARTIKQSAPPTVYGRTMRFLRG